MKIALQTIPWGQQIDQFQQFVVSVRRLGFRGLEFAQKVVRLGDPRRVRAELDRHGLRCVGLSGGSLSERASVASALGAEYLYCDEWSDSEAGSLLQGPVPLALHPHLYKDIGRLEDAEPLLDKHPQLKLIVDTAHFRLAGDNVLNALKKHSDRVAAIHLKDWSPKHGRSPFRFSMGFTSLGRGILWKLLLDVVEWASKHSFDGWLVVEQDDPEGDPLEAAAASMQWLRSNCQIDDDSSSPAGELSSGCDSGPSIVDFGPDDKSSLPLTQLNQMFRSMFPPNIRDPQTFVAQLARCLAQLSGADTVTIWDNNVHTRYVVLHAAHPAPAGSRVPTLIPRKGSLAGLAITACDTVWVAPGSIEHRKAVETGELGARESSGGAILLPIPSLFNQQLVLTVACLSFSDPARARAYDAVAVRAAAGAASLGLDHVLYAVQDDIRYAVAKHAPLATGISGLFERIEPDLRRVLGCGAAALLTPNVNARLARVEASFGFGAQASSDGLLLKIVENFDERRLADCLRTGRGIVVHNDEGSPHVAADYSSSWLLAPILAPRGDMLGALVCSRTADAAASTWFTSVDYDAIDTFVRALGPPMHRMLRLRERTSLQNVLTSIATNITVKAPPADLLVDGIKAAATSLRADIGSIYLLNESTNLLEMRAASGRNEHLVGKASYALGEGVTGGVAKEGKIRVFRSWDEIEAYPSHAGKYDRDIWGADPRPTESLLVAPIIARGQVLGVWKVANVQRSNEHPDAYFTDEDVQLAQVLSSFFAISAVLSQSEAAASRLGQFLAHSWISVTRASNEDEIRLEAVGAMEEHGFEGILLACDPHSDRLKDGLSSSKRLSSFAATIDLPLKSSDPLCESLQTRKTRFIHHDALRGSIIEHMDLESCFILPLCADDERIGVLLIDMGRRVSVNEDDAVFLEAFAAQLSTAISRVRTIGTAADFTDEAASGARFIVAETLASTSVHSVGHILDNIITQLKSDLKRADVRQQRFLLDTLESWCAKLTKVEGNVRQALELVRGDQDEVTEGVDLHAAVQDAIRLWYSYVITHNCKVEVIRDATRFDGHTMPTHSLREIISVLLVNSVQAFAHQIRLRTYNDENVPLSNGSCVDYAFCIEVKDDGIGLAAKNVEEIFSSRYTTKPKKFGTGLGLFIARRLARRAEGDIFVDGAGLKDKGVSFKLVLPLRRTLTNG